MFYRDWNNRLSLPYDPPMRGPLPVAAPQVWKTKVMPVFEKARVRYTVIETERTGHAIEVVAGMRPEELAQYQV